MSDEMGSSNHSNEEWRHEIDEDDYDPQDIEILNSSSILGMINSTITTFVEDIRDRAQETSWTVETCIVIAAIVLVLSVIAIFSYRNRHQKTATITKKNDADV